MRAVTVLCWVNVMAAFGQSPKVPHKMRFADLTLIIHADARREIQEDVDKLVRYPRYFNIKVERAKSYFPIIEKIFREEGLPEDFKFLVLQESALVGDAVSRSNAVGYWQFKDFTAEEVGLRVDKKIDERMNLASSTRGAARYLKRNNFFFNNWLCALQAYQMGPGGAQQALGVRYNGAKRMDITRKTYWYVKKYLAHKIAFEPFVEAPAAQPFALYETSSTVSLKDLAKELSVDYEELATYNKWVLKGSIYDDRKYAVLVPGKTLSKTKTTPSLKKKSPAKREIATARKGGRLTAEGTTSFTVNDIPVVRAQKGESLSSMARRAGVSLSTFLRYNDISKHHIVVPGLPYFTLEKKKNAETPFHKVATGESLWKISQLYGVRLRQLRKYNSLSNKETPSPHTVLWLNAAKPTQDASSQKPEDAIELDKKKSFEWGEIEVQIEPAE